MRTRINLLISPLAGLILEILPCGAVLNFARPAEDGTIGRFRETYSYFSLMPFGYANYGPFITGMLTCVLLAVLIGYLISGGKGWLRSAKGLAAVAFVISLTPILYGISMYSVAGALISCTLAAEWYLIARTMGRDEKK